MESAFQSWIGQPVVVQLNLGQIKLSVRGMFLKEQRDTVMMRTQDGHEFELYKNMVLAVEQQRPTTVPLHP